MSDWLIQRFLNYGDRNCLATSAANHSYGELFQRVEALYETFQQAGIQSGQVVTLNGDYTVDGIAALFALFKLHTIVAPMTALATEEVQLRKAESGARWHIDTSTTNATTIQPISSDTQSIHPLIQSLVDAQEAGLILFSSGSTGRPKAMVHNADHLLSAFEKKRARRHRILIFLLFDHIGGINTLFNGLASGATLVVPENRSPEAVASVIAQHKANLLPASPTFLNLLLMSGMHERYDLSSLRYITYGTEPMPASLLSRLKQSFPETALIQTFGTSETGITQTTSRSSDSTQIKIDDPNTEYKIVEGELWLRSKSQILGYLNHNMDRFTEDGWFKTGDLVEASDDGYLTIQGRREDLINVGGEKVTPSEVESVLMQIPEVADCLVYAESNAITGQHVAAEIVPIDTADTKQLKRAIKQHCRAQLSPYKVPARIVFADSTRFSSRFKKMRRP